MYHDVSYVQKTVVNTTRYSSHNYMIYGTECHMPTVSALIPSMKNANSVVTPFVLPELLPDCSSYWLFGEPLPEDPVLADPLLPLPPSPDPETLVGVESSEPTVLVGTPVRSVFVSGPPPLRESHTCWISAQKSINSPSALLYKMRRKWAYVRARY